MSHFIPETCHLYISHLSKVGWTEPQSNIYHLILLWFMNNAMALFINQNNEKLMLDTKIINLVNIGCNFIIPWKSTFSTVGVIWLICSVK